MCALRIADGDGAGPGALNEIAVNDRLRDRDERDGRFSLAQAGGERFVDLRGQLSLAPDDNIDALELMAICLSIGFVGKYRVMEGGQTQLNRQRHELYRTIRRVRGPSERDLSAGWEVISSPELFIAVAAERTRSIRFGTGVISLPYHNPLMVANRIIQLDHMTRGRVMFGAGPGLLASDALMLGIDPNVQRDRMAEALDVILRLFRGETVTEQTEWYTFVNARAHLLPYTKPHPEVAVVSAVTPSGGRLAGKYDLSMICVAATNPFGFDALGANWQIANDLAAEQGRTMDASRLRLVGPMHIAETREKAFENCRFGFERYLGYLNNNQPRFIVPPGQDAAGDIAVTL